MILVVRKCLQDPGSITAFQNASRLDIGGNGRARRPRGAALMTGFTHPR